MSCQYDDKNKSIVNKKLEIDSLRNSQDSNIGQIGFNAKIYLSEKDRSYVKFINLNNDTIKIIQISDSINYTILNYKDTIGSLSGYIDDVILYDLDGDGSDEIQYLHESLKGVRFDVLSLNTYNNEWRFIEGINKYKQSTKISNSYYYYSYSSNGCADAIWSSHLFNISKNKASDPLLTINVTDCNSIPSKTLVKVYKYNNDEQVLIDSIIIDFLYYDKFLFIQEYWKENRFKFIIDNSSNSYESPDLLCDSNNFIFLIKNNNDGSYNLKVFDKISEELMITKNLNNHRPEYVSLRFCSDELIILSTLCGGPCIKDDVYYINELDDRQSYMYAQYIHDENLVLYRKNEEFDRLLIRNMILNKEILVVLDTCLNRDSEWAGLCNIENLNYRDSTIILENYKIQDDVDNQLIDVRQILK